MRRSTRRSRSAACRALFAPASNQSRRTSPISAQNRSERGAGDSKIGGEGFKIGVVWQGNPDPAADRARSFALTALAPLAGVSGVRLISLQKGFGSEQIASAPFAIESLGELFRRGRGRVRRYGGGDGAPGPRRLLRHFGRPSRGRFGASGMDRAQVRRGVAVDARPRQFAMVSDGAAVPPKTRRRLGRRVRRDGRGARRKASIAHGVVTSGKRGLLRRRHRRGRPMTLNAHPRVWPRRQASVVVATSPLRVVVHARNAWGVRHCGRSSRRMPPADRSWTSASQRNTLLASITLAERKRTRARAWPRASLPFPSRRSGAGGSAVVTL